MQRIGSLNDLHKSLDLNSHAEQQGLEHQEDSDLQNPINQNKNKNSYQMKQLKFANKQSLLSSQKYASNPSAGDKSKDEKQACPLCIQPSFHILINDALFFKYSDPSQRPELYTKQLQQILENRVSAACVHFKQYQILDEDDQQLMRREYKQEQYEAKHKKISEYYKFHQDYPVLHQIGVQRTLQRYYDRKKQCQYKAIKKKLKQEEGISITTHKSYSDFSAEEPASPELDKNGKPKIKKYSTVLEEGLGANQNPSTLADTRTGVRQSESRSSTPLLNSNVDQIDQSQVLKRICEKIDKSSRNHAMSPLEMRKKGSNRASPYIFDEKELNNDNGSNLKQDEIQTAKFIKYLQIQEKKLKKKKCGERLATQEGEASTSQLPLEVQNARKKSKQLKSKQYPSQTLPFPDSLSCDPPQTYRHSNKQSRFNSIENQMERQSEMIFHGKSALLNKQLKPRKQNNCSNKIALIADTYGTNKTSHSRNKKVTNAAAGTSQHRAVPFFYENGGSVSTGRIFMQGGDKGLGSLDLLSTMSRKDFGKRPTQSSQNSRNNSRGKMTKASLAAQSALTSSKNSKQQTIENINYLLNSAADGKPSSSKDFNRANCKSGNMFAKNKGNAQNVDNQHQNKPQRTNSRSAQKKTTQQIYGRVHDSVRAGANQRKKTLTTALTNAPGSSISYASLAQHTATLIRSSKRNSGSVSNTNLPLSSTNSTMKNRSASTSSLHLSNQRLLREKNSLFNNEMNIHYSKPTTDCHQQKTNLFRSMNPVSGTIPTNNPKGRISTAINGVVRVSKDQIGGLRGKSVSMSKLRVSSTNGAHRNPYEKVMKSKPSEKKGSTPNLNLNFNENLLSNFKGGQINLFKVNGISGSTQTNTNKIGSGLKITSSTITQNNSPITRNNSGSKAKSVHHANGTPSTPNCVNIDNLLRRKLKVQGSPKKNNFSSKNVNNKFI